MESVIRTLDFLFGCHHGDLSRVFTLDGGLSRVLQLRRKVRLLAGANAHWAPRTPASDAQMAADWVKQGGLFMSTHSVLDELEQQESVRQSVEEPLAASKVIPSVAPTRYRALFEDSLLETGADIVAGGRGRRSFPLFCNASWYRLLSLCRFGIPMYCPGNNW